MPDKLTKSEKVRGGGRHAKQQRARTAKNDEFYTLLADIERELKNYQQHFADKIVYCNCDDPFESNFFKYFVLNFNRLKLKKLIATCYDGSPIAGKELLLFDYEPEYDKTTRHAHKIIITEVKDENLDGAVNLEDIKWLLANKKNVLTRLNENGDFRSDECIELLKQADIVATNPPFSLFREYIAQLIEYDKKFIVIGNINCITYKEIFSLIKDNKVWLGTGMGRWISGFIVPDTYGLYGTEARIDEKGQRIVATNNCLWLTNLDHKKRHEELILYRNYTPEAYPKYDNYDAINVDKVDEIPMDYDGAIGVPITFMNKYNPEQFVIIGCSYSYGEPVGYHKDGASFDVSIRGKSVYKRLFVRRKK